jgi:haloalkane dehalogenase
VVSLPPAVRALYPFDGHFLDGPAGRMHYLDEGPREGEPLVLVHGNPTWSFFWRSLVLGLRDRYRLIVPDHLGCGLSDRPAEPAYRYTLASRRDDLGRLLYHLSLDRVTLVLHDWGGMIGLAWAVRNLQRVRRLVLLNTSGFPLPATKSLPWSLWFARLPGIGAMLVRGLNLFCRGAVRHCAVKPLSADVRDGYLWPYRTWRDRLAVHRFVQDIPLSPRDEAWPVLHEVDTAFEQLRRIPTLILWGERDFVFDHHFLAEWKRRLPGATVRRYPNGGHYLLEDEAPVVRREVETFLAPG